MCAVNGSGQARKEESTSERITGRDDEKRYHYRFIVVRSTVCFAGCEENDIDTVSSDAQIIELSDGTI